MGFFILKIITSALVFAGVISVLIRILQPKKLRDKESILYVFLPFFIFVLIFGGIGIIMYLTR